MREDSIGRLLSLQFLFCLFLILSCGCTSVGHYYTSLEDSDVESIEINKDTSVKRIAFSAFTIDSDSGFNAMVIFKLIDKDRELKLSSVSFEIDGVKSSDAEKKALFIDAPLEVKYSNSIAEIDGFSERLSSGLPIEFTFKFGKEKLMAKRIIDVAVMVTMLEGGKELKLEKRFKMRRHVRYKSALMMH